MEANYEGYEVTATKVPLFGEKWCLTLAEQLWQPAIGETGWAPCPGESEGDGQESSFDETEKNRDQWWQ